MDNIGNLIAELEVGGAGFSVQGRGLGLIGKTNLLIESGDTAVQVLANRERETLEYLTTRQLQRCINSLFIAIETSRGFINSALFPTVDSRLLFRNRYISMYRIKEKEFRYNYSYAGCLLNPDTCSEIMSHFYCNYCKTQKEKFIK